MPISEFEQIYELIREEVKKAIDEYKKSDPALMHDIDELFSLQMDNIENVTSKLVKLVMKYAERPKAARYIIPSIQATTKDIVVTKKNYERAKRFPHLYPYSLAALRQQYANLKQLWNQKVMILFVEAGVTTKVLPSVWRAIAQMQEIGLGGELAL